MEPVKSMLYKSTASLLRWVVKMRHIGQRILFKAFLRICVLVYGKPFGGAAAAFGPHFLCGGIRVFSTKISCMPYGIAGTHHRRDIMRVKYVLKDNRKVILAFIEYR